MKVAIYCRVSTDEQKNGYSIDAQLNELREYAKKHKYEIYKEYIDAGYSGGLLHRPALDLLLSDAEQQKFKVVLFVKLDRWFRSVPHYYKIQEVLENNNINWIATQEDYETITSSGKFKVNIMLSVSQQFKDATSERIRSVFKYKVLEKKEVLNKSTPLGYEIKNKHYVINPEDAEVVKNIFGSFLNSLSYFEVCNEFNISKERLKRILREKKYVGIYEYNGITIPDMVEPIIDEDTFYKVQSMLDENKTIKHNKKRDYLFTSLVFCKECGGRYLATSSNGHKFYRCRKRTDFTCNNNFTIRETKLEQIVLDQIITECKINIKSVTSQQKKIKDNTSLIRGKQQRLKDLYVDGLINKNEFDIKYKDLESQIIKPVIEKTEEIKFIASDKFLDLYNQLNEKEKSIFYKNIIKNITIARDDIKVEIIV